MVFECLLRWVNGKLCRAYANRNCVIFEPCDTPNLRMIIPLNQIISVRGCHCKKIPKQLICDCVTEKQGDDNATDGDERNQSSRNNDVPEPTSQPLHSVRLFYGVEVGEHRWKVTFIVLPLITIPPSATGTDGSGGDDNANGNRDSSLASATTVLEWIKNVCSLLDELNRPKKLLVFVNPYGGKRRACKIYDTKVAPLFNLARIHVRHIVTERANHARDMLCDLGQPLDDYDGLICVGGDGMLAELINGLLHRTQRQHQINADSVNARLIQPAIPLGVIPAGSTDAVAFGVTGANDPITSTVHCIFGKRIDIDVAAIHKASDETLIRYATSFLGYGYFGDVLADSETNRWMGPKRYDWSGLKKFLGHRLYSGELKLYVSTSDGNPKDQSNICQSNCPLCAKSALRARHCNQSDGHHQRQQEHQEAISDQTCVTIRGQFLAINSATMSCRCDKAKKGISPAAHLGNGCSDLIIVTQCSRFNYLRYLMRTGFLSSSPFDLPFVDVYRVREFTFTPLAKNKSALKQEYHGSTGTISGGSSAGNSISSDPAAVLLNSISSNSMQSSSSTTDKNFSATRNSSNVRNSTTGQSSVWNCDGEVITEPNVRVKVHCQLITLFGTGRENRLTSHKGGPLTLGHQALRAAKVRDLNENKCIN